MSREWHDINEPSGLLRRTAEPAQAQGANKRDTGIDEDRPRSKAGPAVEYRFVLVRAVEPAQGFERNKPFEIEGEVELLGERLSMPRVLLYPIGRYKGQEDSFFPGGIEAYIDSKTLKFRGMSKYLFDPEPYARDESRPSDATWELVIRAEGAAAEKPYESAGQIFPQSGKFQLLRKGDYDEHGARKYGKVHSGEHFRSNGVVKALQADLITVGFLPKGSDDGFFGEQTDAAVRSFQEYAIKPDRMKRSVGNGPTKTGKRILMTTG